MMMILGRGFLLLVFLHDRRTVLACTYKQVDCCDSIDASPDTQPDEPAAPLTALGPRPAWLARYPVSGSAAAGARCRTSISMPTSRNGRASGSGR